ncbi:unnamed protein product [Oppiella nova]|uniref:Uncharacterized protein n=1 Tax=Oppiella nova TaxID=334625 RepID=A0A7R9QR46_9ACAR|nr:unnamed protein product [Oppiella nova]CAG2171265.1 unnamed protein product [Oppiella nova]
MSAKCLINSLIVILTASLYTNADSFSQYEIRDTDGRGTGVYRHLHYNLTCIPNTKSDDLCYTNGLVVFDIIYGVYYSANTTSAKDSHRGFFVWNSTRISDQNTDTLELMIQFTTDDMIVTPRVKYMRSIRLTMVNLDEYTSTSVLKELTFTSSLKDALNHSLANVDIMQNSIINNPSNAKIREKVSKDTKYKMESTLTYGQAFRNLTNYHMNTRVEAGAGIKIWKLKAELERAVEEGVAQEFEYNSNTSQSSTATTEQEFHFSREITVNPFESVEYSAYLEVTKDLSVPYRALKYLTVYGPRSYQNKTLTSLETAMLIWTRTNISNITLGPDNCAIIPVQGMYGSTFGVKSVFNVHQTGHVGNSTIFTADEVHELSAQGGPGTSHEVCEDFGQETDKLVTDCDNKTYNTGYTRI